MSIDPKELRSLPILNCAPRCIASQCDAGGFSVLPAVLFNGVKPGGSASRIAHELVICEKNAGTRA